MDSSTPAKAVKKAVKSTVERAAARVVVAELHTALGAHRAWDRFGAVLS